MWIVLLDHSGSMGEPFRANAQQIEAMGRVRSVEAEIKWEAAKKSFLLELRRLPGDMEVILFGFMGTTHLIYSGFASQFDEFERHLQEVSPDDGTNIAAALSSILEYANKRPQALLITDGLSDLESAKTEARQCASAGIRVDVLVIDPTDKGVEMARAIAGITQGRWDPVASAAQLEKLTGESATAHAVALARTQEILQEAQAEFEEISKNTLDKTKVVFSAGYPSRIGIHQKYPLVVYVHLEQLKDQIEEFLKKEIAATGAMPSSSTAAASTRIPPGALISFKPNIPDIFSNPPQQDVVWMEDYHKVSFEIRYIGDKKEGTACSGFVDVFANGMLVGNIPVSLAVKSQSDSIGDLKPTLSLGSSFNRIFASYARKDIALVHACKEAYKMLGIHLYVDRDDLLSGQYWEPVLRKIIMTSDLFQLYWSQAAADSHAVENEWRLALQVSENRLDNFIRPLYWQLPNPSIPKELGHINFAYLDTRQLQIIEDATIDGDVKMAEKMEMDAIFPVISLTGEDTSDSMKVLQKSIGQAVSFLENLTGLRYYPPTTLLVDDYIVKAVRSHLVVDKAQEPVKKEDDNIEFVLDILRSLALAFHSRHMESIEYHDEEWQKQFYGLKTDLDWQNFWHVRTSCEGGFVMLIEQYLKGRDPLAQPSQRTIDEFSKEMNEKITGYRVDNWAHYTLRREIGHIHAVATSEDRKIIEQIIGAQDLSTLLDDSGKLTEEQIRRLTKLCLSNTYISVSEKYRNQFYDLFGYDETVFCKNRSYTEYFDTWFDYWMSYLKITVKKNNIPVRIGYQPSKNSLEWLKSKFPDIKLEEYPEWKMSTAEIYKTVERLRAILTNAVKHAETAIIKIQKYLSTASTYGIFASAEVETVTRYLLKVTREQNWPAGLALEGSHKVLLCANAFERYKSELLALGADKQNVDEMAAWFLAATLVHEHFHGIAATGIDQHGKSSWAVKDWNEWDKGNLLNESLAAWAERHFFRNNSVMFENISEYIQLGQYPDWPYRGAEKIEEIYKARGLKGVRALINQFREDPQFAQETFDGILV